LTEEPKTTPVSNADQATSAPPSAATPPPHSVVVVTPSPQTAPEPVNKPQYGYWWGTGRRKTAVARVRIRPGDGKFVINKREIDDFFRCLRDRNDILAPLEATGSRKNVDVFVNVCGGGPTGQAGAIMLGLARALCKLNPDYSQALRDGRYLTRDSREVERKKYGQRGARRRFQFSKR